jgi:hypothetical protein
MRTTIDLDPDILSTARQIAADRSISLGDGGAVELIREHAERSRHVVVVDAR